jgi:hypothetical protein
MPKNQGLEPRPLATSIRDIEKVSTPRIRLREPPGVNDEEDLDILIRANTLVVRGVRASCGSAQGNSVLLVQGSLSSFGKVPARSKPVRLQLVIRVSKGIAAGRRRSALSVQVQHSEQGPCEIAQFFSREPSGFWS